MGDYRSKFYENYVSSQLARNPPKSLQSLNKREPYLKALIRDHFPSDRDAKIIDLGCGHGTLVHFARQAGYRNAIGVDTSEEQIRAAENLGIEGVTQGDVLEVVRNAPDFSYDAIIAFDLIEHLTKSELLDFSCEVRRALKPTGRFIIHAPNAGSPFFGTVRYGDYTHEQAFTSRSISQILLTCGFAAVRCYEEAPIPHGVKSTVRFWIWKALRFAMAAYIAAETGNRKGQLFTQNFLAVGYVTPPA